MWDVIVLQVPHILAQSSTISIFFIFKTAGVSIISCFECVFCKSDVRFHFVAVFSGDCGLVHDAWGKTTIFNWAFPWVSAVAVCVALLPVFFFSVFVEQFFVVC